MYKRAKSSAYVSSVVPCKPCKDKAPGFGAGVSAPGNCLTWVFCSLVCPDLCYKGMCNLMCSPAVFHSEEHGGAWAKNATSWWRLVVSSFRLCVRVLGGGWGCECCICPCGGTDRVKPLPVVISLLPCLREQTFGEGSEEIRSFSLPTVGCLAIGSIEAKSPWNM